MLIQYTSLVSKEELITICNKILIKGYSHEMSGYNPLVSELELYKGLKVLVLMLTNTKENTYNVLTIDDIDGTLVFTLNGTRNVLNDELNRKLTLALNMLEFEKVLTVDYMVSFMPEVRPIFKVSDIKDNILLINRINIPEFTKVVEDRFNIDKLFLNYLISLIHAPEKVILLFVTLNGLLHRQNHIRSLHENTFKWTFHVNTGLDLIGVELTDENLVKDISPEDATAFLNANIDYLRILTTDTKLEDIE